jgi:putative membrane-bound dehydrogenase-like protein
MQRGWRIPWRGVAIASGMWVWGMCMLAAARHGAADEVADDAAGLQAPAGFQVSLFADDDLAHDIYSMTIDAAGRVVVAGPGYVKTLHDDDGDGRADRATLFSPVPASGAHGMCFDGHDLICTGDNAVGRLRDADGDGAADGPMEVWTHLRHPEHGANGIVRGPDGWYYLICGNDAGVSREHANLPGSPVADPRCGAVVRFTPDGQQSDVFAHGFRNPYDLDFNAQGHLFTVDADGERDHHLPWYAPARLFDVAQGMEHGWLLAGWQRSWNRPESFFDNVERAVEIGRGSPTGLVCYRHHEFPSAYRGGLFSACWTLGRVYHLPLEPSSSSYASRADVFLQTTGDVGFAPVDLAVGPAGDLFVAIGGRGTRGGVFRVRYVGDEDDGRRRLQTPTDDEHDCRRRLQTPTDGAATGDGLDPLSEVLTAPQPLSSWSRARWVPRASEVGRAAFVAAMTDDDRDSAERVRAVEVLVELFGGIQVDEARAALAHADDAVMARMAWALGTGRNGNGLEACDLLVELVSRFHSGDPRVVRAGWEALMQSPPENIRPPRFEPEAPVLEAWGLNSDDRRIRAAAVLVARNSRELAAHRGSQRATVARLWISAGQETNIRDVIAQCRDWFIITYDRDVKLDAIRRLQVALGDLRLRTDQPEVYSGYSANDLPAAPRELVEKTAAQLAGQFPTGDAEVDRELARLLGMLQVEDSGLLDRLAAKWTDDSTVVDDIHYLIVFSRLPGERSAEVTRRTAHALTALHGKLSAGRMYPSRNWPARVGECLDELLKRDPALAAALIDEPAFGLADHGLFAARLPPDQKPRAVRKLLAAALAAEQADDDDPTAWTPELIELLAVLPVEERMPHLRAQWDDYGLRDAIALVLARDSQTDDRQRLVEALDSTQADVIVRAAEALRSLPGPGSPDELLAALRTLRQYCAARPQRSVRDGLTALLRHWTDQRIEVVEPSDGDVLAAYRPWFDWFAIAHPDAAARLASAGTIDPAAWRERLAEIDWTSGEAARGQAVFERRQCHRCHRGTSRLGPDLVGAAGRLSRDDLFTAIVDPNKDVSPLYQTHLVVTRSGKVYHGLLVYESPDGTLVQTGADTTARVAGDDLLSIAPSRQSLMPTNLLQNASGQDLADLYAWLRTLTPAGR